MQGCMFCDQESKHEAPSNMIAQNEYATAVMADDFREGHCVVNVKRHIQSISELTPEEYNGLFEIIVKVSKALEKKYSIDKTYIMSVSDGPGGHIHFHMIPKHKNLPSIGVYWINKMKEAEPPRKPSAAQQNSLAKEVREIIDNS